MSPQGGPGMTNRVDESELAYLDSEVVELALLLPAWQAQALANAASRRGMTAGQMLRRVIGELLKSQPRDLNP